MPGIAVTFEDLFSLEDMQRIQDEFSAATGVASIITRPDGTPITKPSNFTRFCADIIRKNEAGCANCLKSDALLGRHNPKGPIVQRCTSGGLWDAGASLTVGGQHVANWLIGQVRDQTQDEAGMRAYARAIGVDEAELIAAFREVPIMDLARFQQVAQVLFTLANQLAASAYQNLQRAQTEAEQQKILAKYKALFDHFPLGITVADSSGKILESNAISEEILGLSRNAHAQRTIDDPEWTVVRPDGTPMPPEEYASVRALKEKRSIANVEMGVRTPADRITWLRTTAAPLPTEGKGVVVAYSDITELKELERALHESAERFRMVLQDIPTVAVQGYGPEGITRYWNKASERLYGYTAEEAIGRNLLDLIIPPEMREGVALAMQQMARDGQAIPASELTLMRKDGSRVNVFSSHVIVQVPGQPLELFCIDVDLTERRRAEEALRAEKEKYQQLQKAESLSRMAGAIAHHFNNQLQAVTGYLELALLSPEVIRGGAAELLAQAMKAADKASEVSGLMLTYLGQRPTERETLDLSVLCLHNLALLRAALPVNVTLETNLSTPGPTTHVNADQVQQVLTNLMTNAWESSAGGSNTVRVTLTTVAADAIPSKHRYPVDFQPNNATYACLEVADQGSGIAGDNLDQLFDPFFTTKFTGRGLGLAVALGLVRAHEGVITVESSLGKGSAFRVYLPVVTAASATPSPGTAPADQGNSTSARTILLAEDNPEVRTLASATLKQMGFTVIEAKDGAEAVALYRQHRAAIACVLCDLVMPNLDGWATIEALRALCPGLPIVLVSGYNESRVMAGEHPQKPQAFLGKPYQKSQLRDALAQAMGTTG